MRGGGGGGGGGTIHILEVHNIYRNLFTFLVKVDVNILEFISEDRSLRKMSHYVW